MPLMPVKKVLFDLDGTLVDTAADLHAATNHCLKLIGRNTVNLQTVRHLTGYGALRLLEAALEATGGITSHTPEDLREDFLQYYTQNICVGSTLYPGVIELLNHLDSHNIPYGICTNKPLGLATKLMKALDIHDRFAAVTGGDSFPFKKPDPRHMIRTAALLNGDGPIAMVGDASPDIKGAKAAGITAVAVSYGYADIPLSEMQPDLTVGSLTELTEIFEPA